PLVAVADDQLTVAAQMPWMRYREPQALRVDGTTLSLRLVSTDLRVGEGKGIWGHARVSLTPTALAPDGQTLAAFLEQLRVAMRAELERGLVPWPGRAAVNAARAFPSLGTGAAHTARNAYLEWIELLHAETVDPGGQWDRDKTYGSQLWPETGGNDPFGIDSDFPNQNSAGMNYWDPAGAETIEFLSTGDPRWLWDFALMGYWTQMHLAYLNTGFNFVGNRNGLAVESGGPGCPPGEDPCTADGTGGGHWHRTGGGSDDYAYAMSIELGYALRPNLLLRDRFAQAGQTVRNRYDTAIPEANRDQFISVIDVSRQVIQHFEMLANCAELIPGQRGQDCHDRLLEVIGELARDNLAAGILCTGNTANGEILGPPAPLPTECSTPAQFMQNALMYQFLHRFYSNYRHAPGAATQTTVQRVRRALVDSPRVLYEQGIQQDAGGVPVPFGDWAAALLCNLGDGTAVVSCEAASDGESETMYAYNQVASVALLLMAHDVDPSVDLCLAGRAAFDDPALTGGPDDGGAMATVSHFNQAGWWKAVSQMMQGVAFGVGLNDVCTQNPAADLAVTKTNGVTAVTAGGAVTYQVTVTNNGPQDVAGAVLTDVLDGAILDLATVSFTCAPVGATGAGSVCPLAGDAADLAAGVAFDLEAGDAVRFTIEATVRADASGTLVNTATVAPPAGVTDGTSGNNSATDSDPVGSCVVNDFETVTGNVTTDLQVQACVRIDTDAAVGADATLTLQAPLVRFDPGFSVQAGGGLVVVGGLPLE
ncbi:MAG TPA: DUF11 domain-containing protein, partial [Euzebya sp.]|nr:DUF11 domain-containing protein [Euzebya sp.]